MKGEPVLEAGGEGKKRLKKRKKVLKGKEQATVSNPVECLNNTGMGCGYCLCHKEAVMTSSRAVLGVKWKDLDEKKKKERDEAIEMVVEISVSLIEKWKSN